MTCYVGTSKDRILTVGIVYVDSTIEIFIMYCRYVSVTTRNSVV
jgi:hypothetical protein